MMQNQWWKKKIANPISKIDDYVKHLCREHNSETDHWANVGAEGQRSKDFGMAVARKIGKVGVEW